MVENLLLFYKKKLVRKEVLCERKEKENYGISIFVPSSPGGVLWQYSNKTLGPPSVILVCDGGRGALGKCCRDFWLGGPMFWW